MPKSTVGPDPDPDPICELDQPFVTNERVTSGPRSIVCRKKILRAFVMIRAQRPACKPGPQPACRAAARVPQLRFIEWDCPNYRIRAVAITAS